ncbi:DUF2975 domain-containing protein [Arthrobacter jiangjiafuii]|uniref:DUF2975 domain-containing protein n=1 Tax=Arthrobacter jiangjiafuii TaxID=2817475 RepID=A0A975M7C8_9MICC|nr:DUF2975 domain-containing protein [Arthrobacter jiangjiafuii]MBP3044360.1 DUF2975 domain-containing protein [Arthrobacter jiangjiafuii]QWC11311.1 DUF2975 domain-containing protein [Arthrobacter jiangjiafuii]
MTRDAIAELKLILAILFAAAVVAQTVILPWMAADIVAHFPEVQSLRQPILVLSVLAVACIEAALLCLWRLLTLAGLKRTSGRQFLRCLDALVVSLLAGAILMGSMLAMITEADQGTGGPIPPLVLLTGIGGCTVAALIVLAKRRQLTVAAERETRRA